MIIYELDVNSFQSILGGCGEGLSKKSQGRGKKGRRAWCWLSPLPWTHTASSRWQPPPLLTSCQHSPAPRRPLQIPRSPWMNTFQWGFFCPQGKSQVANHSFQCPDPCPPRDLCSPAQESETQYLDSISKMTEWSLFISKASHSISQ